MNELEQINAAIGAHKKWKMRLQQAVATGASEFKPSIVKQDNQCDLGKWLYDQIAPEMRQSSHYELVKRQHTQFHLEAGAILELALQGRTDEAQQAFGMDASFTISSSKLKAELISWYIEVLETSQSKDKNISPDKMRAILTQRADALQKTVESQTGESMPLVVFVLGNETYGIATEYVREVESLREVTPVPCTPDFVVGVINIRGSVYSVIDIRNFLGLQKTEITDSTKVILVHAAELELGILADDVKGAGSVLLSEIKPAFATQAGVKEEHLVGVTKDMLAILNVEALLSDERIIVLEQVR